MKRTIFFASALLLAPTLAHAQSATTPINADATHQNAVVLPSMSMDVGMGGGAPSIGGTTFSYGGYHVLGSQIGLSHASGFLFSNTTHLFPFSLRNIGMIATFEWLALNSAGGPTPTGQLDGSKDGPSYYSVQFGPEAQVRVGPILARAAPVLGWRDVSFGKYDALDWRLGGRAQIDYAFGGASQSSSFTVGLFANVDALPAFGWSTGASVSLAFF